MWERLCGCLVMFGYLSYCEMVYLCTNENALAIRNCSNAPARLVRQCQNDRTCLCPTERAESPGAHAPMHQCLVMFGMTAHGHVSRSCSAIGSRLPMLTMRLGSPAARQPGSPAAWMLRASWPRPGGREGRRDRANENAPPRKILKIFCKLATNGLTSIGNLGMTKQGRYTARMTFKSLPLTVREIKATEATLERIYEAAYLGLKGDSLALAAGMLPVEYARLKQLDQIAELAELKGRADSEREHSQHLRNAARNGDAKAALEILKHAHGWVAKQAVSIEVDQRISVIDALRAAESRVIEGAISEAVNPSLRLGTGAVADRQTVRLDNAKADLQSR